MLVLQVLTDEEPLMKRGNHRSADKERVCGRELSLQVVKELLGSAAWTTRATSESKLGVLVAPK